MFEALDLRIEDPWLAQHARLCCARALLASAIPQEEIISGNVSDVCFGVGPNEDNAP